MSGILDPKSRLLDFEITSAGKRLLSETGQLQVSYVSFSDAGTYYAKLSKTGSVAEDASGRLMIEANSFSSDEASQNSKDTIFSVSGSLVGNITGSDSYLEITAAQRSSQLIDKLRGFRILKTVPGFLSEEEAFNLSSTTTEFIAERRDAQPFGTTSRAGAGPVTKDIKGLSDVYQDARFQHLPNYRYLPPVSSISNNPLGDYQKLNADELTSFGQVETSLEGKKYEQFSIKGRVEPKNIVIRLIEEVDNAGAPLKSDPLEIIDYGSYTGKDKKTKRVFFAGKVFDDPDGVPTFVNIFTLVFSS